MAECQECPRTDLNLTQNGRVKSHAANGKRASADNPHCPGGSDWPKEHVRALAVQGNRAAMNTLVGWGEDPSGDGSADNRPTEQDVKDAGYVQAHGAPDDVYDAAEHVLCIAEEYGTRGSFHTGTSEPVQPNPHRSPVPTGWPEAQAAGWTEEEWADYNSPGGALRRLTREETGDGSWQGGTTQQPSSPAAGTGAPTTDQSSRPGTTASAGSATSGSRKATSSGAPGAGISSMPNVSGTGSVNSGNGSNPATDFINSKPNTAGGAPATGRGDNDVPRDRWGRYLLPHPQTGQVQPWTRATTMANSVSDTFTLSAWSQRMVAKGITLRPDLYALAAGYSVSADKDDMNSVCEQAKSAAGDKVAANLGTAMHNFTAAVDRGQEVNIPPSMQADVDAYSAALRAYGFELVPDMIERRIVLTKSVAGEDIGGTFDRVYRASRAVDIRMADKTKVHLEAGSHVIADLKTGRDLAYGWGEIAIQETIYAHGLNQNGVWDKVKKEWNRLPLGYTDDSRPDGTGGTYGPEPVQVSEKVGIVVHLPIQKGEGKPACVLYAVDLEQGWNAIQLCVQVRQWRKQKQIASELAVVDQPVAVSAPVDVSGEPCTPASGYDGLWAVSQQREADRVLAEGEPRTPASGYDRPTAAQMADHPSVAHPAAAQTPPVAHVPTWEERAGSVSTKAEASALYQAMRPQVQKIGQNRFNKIVKSMQERLASLVEQGG